VGPFFLPDRLNGPLFLEFLRDSLLPALRLLFPQDFLQNMWFQMDGAPPHWARVVRDFVNVVFGERWIGRGGSVEMPPRSPDLTPLDFFVWGFLRHCLQRANSGC